MNIVKEREYRIYRRYQGDDLVQGQQLTERPLICGLWPALQTMHRMSCDPDNYLTDSYLKLVSPRDHGSELLCAAIVLEPEQVNRTYFLQYTNGESKKTHDVATLDAGLWCAISSMFSHYENRKRVQKSKGGYFTLCFYQGKKLTNKVLLRMGA